MNAVTTAPTPLNVITPIRSETPMRAQRTPRSTQRHHTTSPRPPPTNTRINLGASCSPHECQSSANELWDEDGPRRVVRTEAQPYQAFQILTVAMVPFLTVAMAGNAGAYTVDRSGVAPTAGGARAGCESRCPRLVGRPGEGFTCREPPLAPPRPYTHP